CDESSAKDLIREQRHWDPGLRPAHVGPCGPPAIARTQGSMQGKISNGDDGVVYKSCRYKVRCHLRRPGRRYLRPSCPQRCHRVPRPRLSLLLLLAYRGVSARTSAHDDDVCAVPVTIRWVR